LFESLMKQPLGHWEGGAVNHTRQKSRNPLISLKALHKGWKLVEARADVYSGGVIEQA
jgi:hypothetical protein